MSVLNTNTEQAFVRRRLAERDAEPFTVARTRAEWKNEVRDPWASRLDDVEHGRVIAGMSLAGEPTTHWTKIGTGFRCMWQSGLNVVSTVVLCRLHDSFDLSPRCPTCGGCGD